jgi:uncharacterized membrane protein YjjP (DUF1212 family)
MQIPQKYQFIVQLGKALHTYGVPSYKSQIYLTEIAEKKGIKASFMDTPTWINYVFYEEDDHTYNYIECVKPGDLNLGALSRIVEITNLVINNKLSFGEAKLAIEKIDSEPLSYGKLAELLAFMISAGAFSLLLDTSWTSSILASLIGAVIYGITLLAQKSSYISSTLEALVAFVATIATGVLSTYFTGVNISMTILASIIIFIPGLSITTALEEITSRSLVSGTAKLFDSLVSLFKQFFGVVLGLAVLPVLVDVVPTHIVYQIPHWVDYISVLLLALALTIVFKVRGKDAAYCIMAGFVSYNTTILLESTGLLISIFIGTIVTVALSKLFSRITKSPEIVFLVPGIVMLVPGSKAFIGLSSVFLQATDMQTNMGEQILYIFMGIIGGLLFSGSFIDPKVNLKIKSVGKR